MNEDHFPIGQRITLPGHFVHAVTLEAVRRIGSSYECRVRLSDGTPDRGDHHGRRSLRLDWPED